MRLKYHFYSRGRKWTKVNVVQFLVKDNHHTYFPIPSAVHKKVHTVMIRIFKLNCALMCFQFYLYCNLLLMCHFKNNQINNLLYNVIIFYIFTCRSRCSICQWAIRYECQYWRTGGDVLQTKQWDVRGALVQKWETGKSKE